jgi:membrane protease YdiL (CAAX protease family)
VSSLAPPGSSPPPGPPSSDEPEAASARAAIAPRPVGRAAWAPWTALVALLSGFGIAILGTGIIAVVAVAAGYSMKPHPPAGVNIVGVLVQDVGFIFAALVFAQLAGRPTAADFGLLRTPIGRAIGWMLAVGIGFVAFGAIWTKLLSLDQKQTLPTELGINGSTLALVLVILFITVLAPLSEELLFRGYIFSALRNWNGFWPAAIVTGLLFGAVHIGSTPIGLTVPLACFGFGLCLLYERTGSLYPGIALHALNNAVALGGLQKWSGQEVVPLMIGAVIAALTLAALLGQALGRRAEQGAGPFPAPAV